MSNLIILSKNKLTNAELIFKESLVYDGVKRWSSKNSNDRVYLRNLLNLDKVDTYDHVIMIENPCQKNMTALRISEKDFYLFEANKNNLNLLRKINKDLQYGEDIIILLEKLCSKNFSKILSKSDLCYSFVGQLLPFTINIDTVFRSFSNFVINEYNSYFLKNIISTRDNLLTYCP